MKYTDRCVFLPTPLCRGPHRGRFWFSTLVVLAACNSSSSSSLSPPGVIVSSSDASPSALIVEQDAGSVQDASSATVSPGAMDETKVLGAFATEYAFQGKEKTRAHNIELAASRLKINLLPGEVFRFNDVVGVRSKENGFKEAGVIYMGLMDTDIGGGTCQVSSTIHAAALMAGMKVLSRTPHSRFSSYIAPGLDATVVYPPECMTESCYSVDLVIKNPYDVSVGLRAEILEPLPKKRMKRLQIQFVGMQPSFKPAYAYRARTFGDAGHQYFQSETVSDAAYMKRIQKSSPGYKIVSTITYNPLEAGTVAKVDYASEYQPVDEVWEVGQEYEGDPPWDLRPDAGADAGVQATAESVP